MTPKRIASALRDEAERYDAAAKQQDEMDRQLYGVVRSGQTPGHRSRTRAALFREAATLIEKQGG